MYVCLCATSRKRSLYHNVNRTFQNDEHANIIAHIFRLVFDIVCVYTINATGKVYMHVYPERGVHKFLVFLLFSFIHSKVICNEKYYPTFYSNAVGFFNSNQFYVCNAVDSSYICLFHFQNRTFICSFNLIGLVCDLLAPLKTGARLRAHIHTNIAFISYSIKSVYLCGLKLKHSHKCSTVWRVRHN